MRLKAVPLPGTVVFPPSVRRRADAQHLLEPWQATPLLLQVGCAVRDGVAAAAAAAFPEGGAASEVKAIERALLREAWKKLANPFISVLTHMPLQSKAAAAVARGEGLMYGDIESANEAMKPWDLFADPAARQLSSRAVFDEGNKAFRKLFDNPGLMGHASVVESYRGDRSGIRVALKGKAVVERLEIIATGAAPVLTPPSAARLATEIYHCEAWISSAGARGARLKRFETALAMARRGLANVHCVAYDGDAQTGPRTKDESPFRVKVYPKGTCIARLGSRKDIDVDELPTQVVGLFGAVPTVDGLLDVLIECEESFKRYARDVYVGNDQQQLAFTRQAVPRALRVVRNAMAQEVVSGGRPSDMTYVAPIFTKYLDTARGVLEFAGRRNLLVDDVLKEYFQFLARPGCDAAAAQEALSVLEWCTGFGFEPSPSVVAHAVLVLASHDTAAAETALRAFEAQGNDTAAGWAQLPGHALLLERNHRQAQVYWDICKAKGVSSERVARAAVALFLRKRTSRDFDITMVQKMLDVLPDRSIRDKWGGESYAQTYAERERMLEDELLARSLVAGADDRVERVAAMLLGTENSQISRSSELHILTPLLRCRQRRGDYSGCFEIFRRARRKGVSRERMFAQYISDMYFKSCFRDSRDVHALVAFWEEVLRPQEAVLKGMERKFKDRALRRLYEAFKLAGEASAMQHLRDTYGRGHDFSRYDDVPGTVLLNNARKGAWAAVDRELGRLAARAAVEGATVLESPVRQCISSLEKRGEKERAGQFSTRVQRHADVPEALKQSLRLSGRGNPVLKWIMG
eukprot:TRINITY_DN24835_c0_g1_i1.p1 TRINITY_DN24835_c0_g1~~TRINITY_DN24835_c0_g1_i1.p1  ORF type:complete len:807 (+),score=194.93 TRINITY_DN24835_c0_g1_i1:78-2498(+)